MGRILPLSRQNSGADAGRMGRIYPPLILIPSKIRGG